MLVLNAPKRSLMPRYNSSRVLVKKAEDHLSKVFHNLFNGVCLLAHENEDIMDKAQVARAKLQEVHDYIKECRERMGPCVSVSPVAGSPLQNTFAPAAKERK